MLSDPNDETRSIVLIKLEDGTVLAPAFEEAQYLLQDAFVDTLEQAPPDYATYCMCGTSITWGEIAAILPVEDIPRYQEMLSNLGPEQMFEKLASSE